MEGRRRLDQGREHDRTIQLSIALLLNIVLYAVGAILAVEGKISIGTLIGANILSSRCLRNASQFAHACLLVLRGGKAAERLAQIRLLPREALNGTALRVYSGRLRLADLSFRHEGAGSPLFEGLEVELSPGALLLVCGKNGSGKSTLARLIAGLLVPGRGEILADGVALSQIAPPWWHRQLMYLPQEPGFFEASIRENIVMARPDITADELESLLDMADLRTFLAHASQGLNTPMSAAASNLPAGIRKRIALARALATGGRLALFDEPFENIDADGRQAVATTVRRLLEEKRGVILFTHDVRSMGGANLLLDLNEKPKPRLLRCDAGLTGFMVRP